MSFLSQISRDFMLHETAMSHLIRSAPHRYRVFEIPKKSGKGKRIIAQPAREIKALQYWAIDNILQRLPVHQAAMAYRKGRSIRDNAAKHARQRFLLKLDFEDFFPSIRSEDLDAYFAARNAKNLSSEDISLLKSLLFWKPKGSGKLIMSIGAPSSPILSNILLYDFDKRVQSICKENRVTYSRYADDLTFSTSRSNVLRDIENQVAQVCRSMSHPKLRINKGKTIHASLGGMRMVTGLILSNDGTPSLGRERKRQVRSQIHHFLEGKLRIEEALALRGTLAFINSAEPEFLERLMAHYGQDKIAKILNLRDSAGN